MNFCYMLRILISQQVFQSRTSTAEEKNATAGSHCNEVCLEKLQFVPKAILKNCVREKIYSNADRHFLCSSLSRSSVLLCVAC